MFDTMKEKVINAFHAQHNPTLEAYARDLILAPSTLTAGSAADGCCGAGVGSGRADTRAG